jgi:hypothetical protein
MDEWDEWMSNLFKLKTPTAVDSFVKPTFNCTQNHGEQLLFSILNQATTYLFLLASHTYTCPALFHASSKVILELNDSATGFHDSNGDGDRERVREIVLLRMKTECGRRTSSGTKGGRETVASVAGAGAAGAAGGGAEEKE